MLRQNNHAPKMRLEFPKNLGLDIRNSRTKVSIFFSSTLNLNTPISNKNFYSL